MKKKYRVTTRGKVVFSLVGLLILYGVYMLLSPTPAEIPVEPSVSEVNISEEQAEIEAGVEEEETEVDQVQPAVEAETQLDNSETEKIENCTTNKTVTSEDELRLIEAAGFTIYYEPNAYYVPEGEIPLIAEFAAVAKAHPDEQIVIEGNVNKSFGPEEEWDTEDVNQLGYTRGLVIKNDLIKRGIDKKRIIIYNNKDEKPLHVDLSKKSIALNRRVDVFFSQFMYDEIDTK